MTRAQSLECDLYDALHSGESQAPQHLILPALMVLTETYGTSEQREYAARMVEELEGSMVLMLRYSSVYGKERYSLEYAGDTWASEYELTSSEYSTLCDAAERGVYGLVVQIAPPNILK